MKYSPTFSFAALFFFVLAASFSVSIFSCLAGESGTINIFQEVTSAKADNETHLSKPESLVNLEEIRRLLAKTESRQEIKIPLLEKKRMGLSLEQSLKIALENNLDVKIATLNKDAFIQGIRSARSIFHPTAGLSLTGAGKRRDSGLNSITEPASQTATAFISEALPTGGNLTLSNDFIRQEGVAAPADYESALKLTFSQPILKGGRLSVATKPIRDAEIDLRIEEARLRTQILKVAAITKKAYYEAALAENIKTVTEAAIQRDKILVAASAALLKAGLVTVRDLISAQIRLAQDSEKLIRVRTDLESRKNLLSEVLGLPLGTEIILTDKEIDFEPINLVLGNWIKTALVNRPEILEVEEQLAKNGFEIRARKNALLPQLDLVLSLETSQTGSSFFKALGFEESSWSAGLVFSFPLGNAAAEAELQKAEIEKRRLEHILTQRQRQVEIEVRAVEIKLRNSLSRMKVLTMILEEAKKLEEAAKARFALGVTTNLDIIKSQDDILEAETDLLGAIVDYNVGLAELEASLAVSISYTDAKQSQNIDN